MKTEHKIIVLSIIFGILVWLADAVIDYLFFFERSFIDLIYLDVPPHEIYIRIVFIVFLIIFGLVIARDMRKLRKAETALKDAHDKLERKVAERTANLKASNEKLKIEISERKQVEEDLCKTKEFLDNIIQSSLDCIVVTDRNGYVTRVNEAFIKMLGYNEEQILGTHISKFSVLEKGSYKSTTGKQIEIPERFFADAQKASERLLTEGKRSCWRTYFLSKDKQIIPVEENSVILYNASGEITGAVAIIRDITTRKKSEEEKARINNKLQDKVAELSILNEIGEVLLSTRELDEILHIILIGVTAHQALGFNRAFLFLINEQGTMLEGKTATGPLNAGNAHRIWNQLTFENQPLKEILISRHGELSHEDEPINQLVKEIRLSLNRKNNIFTQAVYEKKYFNVVDGMCEGFVDKDFIKLLGTDSFVLVPLVSRDKPLGVLLADNAINKRHIKDDEVTHLLAFANHASLAIENANLYKKLTEKIEELSDTYHELKENRDRLIRYERLSAVGRVAAEITHEIKSPLVSIGGFARRMLKNGQDVNVNKNYLNIIIEETNRLEQTLTDILYFARPADPTYNLVDLNSVIENTIDVLSSEMEQKNVTVERDLDNSLPMLQLDANQIKRVLINIIRNAIEAMPSGGTISIETFIANQFVKIEIADTGKGISEKETNKLFDAFYTSKANGSGLGLTISAQIISNHEGTIEVHNKEPNGAIFTITLPLKSFAEENTNQENNQIELSNLA